MNLSLSKYSILLFLFRLFVKLAAIVISEQNNHKLQGSSNGFFKSVICNRKESLRILGKLLSDLI